MVIKINRHNVVKNATPSLARIQAVQENRYVNIKK